MMNSAYKAIAKLNAMMNSEGVTMIAAPSGEEAKDIYANTIWNQSQSQYATWKDATPGAGLGTVVPFEEWVYENKLPSGADVGRDGSIAQIKRNLSIAGQYNFTPQLIEYIQKVVTNSLQPLLDDLTASNGFIVPVGVAAATAFELAEEGDVLSANVEAYEKFVDEAATMIDHNWKSYTRNMKASPIAIAHQQNFALAGVPYGGFTIKGHNALVSNFGSAEAALKMMGPMLYEHFNRYANWSAANPGDKEAPSLCAIQILDPAIKYAGSSSNMLQLTSRHMPTTELSRCIPYFNLQMRLPGEPTTLKDSGGNEFAANRPKVSAQSWLGGFGAPGQAVNATLEEPLDFLQMNNQGEEVEGTPMAATPKTISGMEMFTMPQTINNFDQPVNSFRQTGHIGFNGGAGSSPGVDKTRPFMSVTSFSEKVNPTRGTMSATTATLSLKVHDRRSLSQLEAMLSPATLSTVEFEISYGWSHPDGGPLSNNVWGQLMNSCRAGGVYTPYKTSMKADDKGQFDVTIELVSKGAANVNMLDAAMTGRLSTGYEAIKEAFDAFEMARQQTATKTGLKQKYVAKLQGTQQVATMTLGQTGNLLDKEKLKSLKEFRRKVNGRNDPKLSELSTALGDLMQAVSSANETLQADLDKKITFLKGRGIFNSTSTYVDVCNSSAFVNPAKLQSDTEFSITAEDILPLIPPELLSRYASRRNTANLGMILQLFVQQPMAATGLYDEVQIVYYTANAHAGQAAGTCLSAIPIDLASVGKTSFESILKEEYKKYGGQYPITRFIKFLAKNFIEPSHALCYGLKKPGVARTYDKDTGRVGIKEPQDLEEYQNSIASKLREIYYGNPSPNSNPLKITNEKFKPIKLRLHFETGTYDVADRTARQANAGVEWAQTQGSAGTYAIYQTPKTTLRISVVDEADSAMPGPLEVMEMLKTTGGYVAEPVPRKNQFPGMNPALMMYFNRKGSVEYDVAGLTALKQLVSANILAPITVPPTPMTPEQIKALEDERDSFKQYDWPSPLAQYVSFQRREEMKRRKAEIDAILVNPVNPVEGTAFRLVADPITLINYVASLFPGIVYGEEGSTITQLSLASDTNSKAATIRMINAMKGKEDGKPDRGLPFRTSPVKASIKMLGNPYLRFMQKFFLRADTGTTIDNLYAVTSVTHTITPTNYETSAELVPQDAYFTFFTMASEAATLKAILDAMATEAGEEPE